MLHLPLVMGFPLPGSQSVFQLQNSLPLSLVLKTASHANSLRSVWESGYGPKDVHTLVPGTSEYVI